MTSLQEKPRYRVSTSLIIIQLIFIICFSSAWADGSLDEEFFERYTPSKREMCEIYKSWLSTEQMNAHSAYCKGVALFKPIRTLKADINKKEQAIYLSSKRDNDWPLVDVSVKAQMNPERLKITSFLLNGYGYDLSEYTASSGKWDYSEISVGYIGEVIILQLRENRIEQLFFIPQHCDDGEVEYSVNQVFSWYPPMQEDSYSKTFITSPSCI